AGDDDVPPVRGEGQQGPVQEFALGPPQPPLVLLLQPPHNASKWLLGAPSLIQEGLELGLQLLGEAGSKLLGCSGEPLGGGQRSRRTAGGQLGRIQRGLAKGQLSFVSGQPPGPAKVASRQAAGETGPF